MHRVEMVHLSSRWGYLDVQKDTSIHVYKDKIKPLAIYARKKYLKQSNTPVCV